MLVHHIAPNACGALQVADAVGLAIRVPNHRYMIFKYFF
jgi:hypothetical protein